MLAPLLHTPARVLPAHPYYLSYPLLYQSPTGSKPTPLYSVSQTRHAQPTRALAMFMGKSCATPLDTNDEWADRPKCGHAMEHLLVVLGAMVEASDVGGTAGQKLASEAGCNGVLSITALRGEGPRGCLIVCPPPTVLLLQALLPSQSATLIRWGHWGGAGALQNSDIKTLEFPRLGNYRDQASASNFRPNIKVVHLTHALYHCSQIISPPPLFIIF